MLNVLPRVFSRSAPRQSDEFDFLMGIWRCRHRYRVARLSGCNDWIEFDGTCAARKLLAGYANTDESDIGMPGGRYTGVSLRLWDPACEQWTIHWLDSRDPGRIGPPVRGGFKRGSDGSLGIFYGDDEHDGRAIRVRYIWSRLATGAPRWEQAFSLDEGNDWETNWVMDFARI